MAHMYTLRYPALPAQGLYMAHMYTLRYPALPAHGSPPSPAAQAPCLLLGRTLGLKATTRARRPRSQRGRSHQVARCCPQESGGGQAMARLVRRRKAWPVCNASYALSRWRRVMWRHFGAKSHGESASRGRSRASTSAAAGRVHWRWLALLPTGRRRAKPWPAPNAGHPLHTSDVATKHPTRVG
jgi:hypothetical protein